jgi:predicted nucleic acid-binding protein
VTGWLLDTSIISQLAPNKGGAPRLGTDLASWLRDNTDDLFLSALSITEIRAGIRKLRRAGGTRRADDLEAWLGRAVTLYGDRVLPLDVETALVAGDIADHAQAVGRDPGLADVLIAATAEARDLSILTDNVRHFEGLDLRVQVLNPLEAIPPRRS